MSQTYDVIIIGGGPAGITAGIYCSRQKINVLLVAKGFGGQMAKKAVNIENYTGFESVSGIDLIKKFENHLKKNKIEIEIDEVIKAKKVNGLFSITTKSRKIFKTKSIIVASGADPRKLEVVGEKKFIGKGVSYCALCDGPMFSSKDVVVIGGGNSAFETALVLSNYANKIYILENSAKVRADEDNQTKVEKNKKIEIITNATLKKIDGDIFVNSVTYQNKIGQNIKLNVFGVFIEIGYQPANAFIKDAVDFNERDEIKINAKTCETSVSGIFACGDVTNVFAKQIIIACGEGAKAAVSACNFVKK